MTVPGDWDVDEPGDYVAEVNEDIGQQFPVVPVKVMFNENERVPPEFVSCMTWPIPVAGVNSPLQIMPRSQTRYKAKWMITFPAAGTVWLNNTQAPLSGASPQGYTVTVAAAINFPLPDYEAQQAMSAVASIPGVTISVFDELYGAVASG
jgi:hypothetical protein